MNGKKIDLVVGSSAGDEGKGIITSRIAKSNPNDKIANVLTNGGAQRGHSVCFNNVVHIFHHFGSASIFDATTFYDRNFILNPMAFVKEYEEIYKKCHIILPNAVRDAKCKWTTPFDMMYNQIMSKLSWKGTCGMGIWDTIVRYNDMPDTPLFGEFCEYSKDKQIEFLKKVKEYYEKKMLVHIFPDYIFSWDNSGMIEHFIDDCMFMFKHTVVNEEKVIRDFDHIVFENGQGLLLNDDGIDDPEKTPSQTGSNSILDFMRDYVPEFDKLNIHYVTRPYLTRHGSRTFRSEFVDCDIDETTETNVFNEWQHNLLYANLNLLDLKNRIDKDKSKWSNLSNVSFTIDVTHCDELDREKEFRKVFEKYTKLNFYDKKEV
jgi:adenylosuccinate synthase